MKTYDFAISDDEYLDLQAKYDQALDELNAANGQIRRHHEDFRRIQEALDEWENGCLTNIGAYRKIRSIVG